MGRNRRIGRRRMGQAAFFVNNESGKSNPSFFFMQKGVTFIELMVVAAIFSLAAITIYSCLISGMNVYRRSSEFDAAQRKEFFVLEKMSQKMRNSLNYPRIGFEGEDSFFSFPYLEGDRILNITYSFDSGQRKLRKITKDFEEFIDGGRGESRVVFSPLKKFKFSYRSYNQEEGEFVWKDEWEIGEGIPKWIKMEWSIDGQEIKERTVSIPIS